MKPRIQQDIGPPLLGHGSLITLSDASTIWVLTLLDVMIQGPVTLTLCDVHLTLSNSELDSSHAIMRGRFIAACLRRPGARQESMAIDI